MSHALPHFPDPAPHADLHADLHTDVYADVHASMQTFFRERLAQRLPALAPAVQARLAHRLVQPWPRAVPSTPKPGGETPNGLGTACEPTLPLATQAGMKAAGAKALLTASGERLPGQAQLVQLVQEMDQRLHSAQAMAVDEPGANADLAALPASPVVTEGPPELPSLRRFGEAWSRVSAQARVSQALGNAPENAGPLNSHRLMLRAMGLMQAASPDYVRRFLAQMDSLLWLAEHPPRRAGAVPAKRAASSPGRGKARPPGVRRGPGSAGAQ